MVRKKSNKIPKIRGRAKSSKVIIANQKQFDEKCDYFNNIVVPGISNGF